MDNLLKVGIDTNIQFFEDNKLVREHKNAIHSKNFAHVISRGLANGDKHSIFKLKFGNQGTYIDGSGNIVYRPPNVTESSEDLYHPTYVEIVDSSSNIAGTGNSVTYVAIPDSNSYNVYITCIISGDEAIESAIDSGTISSSETTFFFDEIGLFVEGSNLPDYLNESDELLLTHLIFSPYEHTGNRELKIIYRLTITVS